MSETQSEVAAKAAEQVVEAAVKQRPEPIAAPEPDPIPDPRIAFRAKLSNIQGRAATAKRRLMLDELADVVTDLAVLVSEILG